MSVISECCVCLASFDVVFCYECYNGVWDVCRSFFVSLCMFTVSKELLISRTTVIMIMGIGMDIGLVMGGLIHTLVFIIVMISFWMEY